MFDSTKQDNKIVKLHEIVSSKNDTRARSKFLNLGRMVTFCIAFLLFLGNVVIQSWALKTQARPETDEGFYLYQAKLITQGYVPYKDFALTTGHVPFLIYLDALVLKICNFDMLTYHLIYVIWVFLTIFPLFYTVLYFTRSRVASMFSILLFSTFVENVQWDSHFFAIRQASFPFFACFVYFFFVAKKEKLSSIFLSLFSFCLITNFLISLVFVIAIFMHSCIKNRRSIREWIKKYVRIYWIFVLLTGIYFALVALIPGSVASIIAVQKAIFYPYSQRIIDVKGMMPLNWPIFLFGTLGILFSIKDNPFLSLLSIFTLFISVFVSGTFYTHYLSVIAVPFAIMGGIFIHKLFVLLSFNKMNNKTKIISICIFFLSLYMAAYSAIFMIYSTIYVDLTEKTPDFFQTVQVLEKCPEPLLALQPIYALYAHKNLVMYYNTTDMRVFSSIGGNLSYEEYQDILNRSNTVLLDPYTDYMFPQGIKKELFQKYDLIYTDGIESIYVRKVRVKASPS